MRKALLLLIAMVLAGMTWWALRGRDEAGPRTVVLFTIDTWRRDRCGAYGALRSPTPRIDAFAARALVVDDARSPIPLTLPAHATMLAGLPPAQTGVRSNAAGRVPDPKARRYPLLPERLREDGWRTGAFVSAAPLDSRYGLDQGFERYDDEGLDDGGGLSFAERPGEATVERAIAWLRSVPAEEPAFLFVHVFEPHAPYAVYDADVANADRAFGAMLDGLDRSGRGDAVVLLTSDHGEALGDLGEPTHGLLLGDAVLRVPMILRGGDRTGRLEGPADLADVAPTLAALAGIDWPAESRVGAGVDLLGASPSGSRMRVAESFYAYQRFRWAQLTASISATGDTLVDVGAGRAYRLRRSPEGEPQALPIPTATVTPDIRDLAHFLAEYKQSERSELITAGAAPGGYAQTGPATPFRPAEENALLPDPYARIAAAVALDQRKNQLGVLPSPRLAAALLEMRRNDEGNPEISFWLGRSLADHAPAEAEAAFWRAWDLGWKDASTLYLAVGVNAPGTEREHLELLRTRGREVVWNCALHGLEAQLLHTLGRSKEACASLDRAESLCATKTLRETLARLRTEMGCR